MATLKASLIVRLVFVQMSFVNLGFLNFAIR